MTSTSSDRFQVQQLIELELGCSNPEDLKSYKGTFEALTVSDALHAKLVQASSADATGLYFKAILSISEAILAVSKGYHSWSLVKLYYAAFYLTRCIFAARSIAMVKCAGIYTLKVDVGASPEKRDKGKFRGQDIKGDHKTVLATYIKDVGATDRILSNTINGETVFEWMMRRREEVHYRAPTFFEPEFRGFEISIHEDGKLAYWVNEYLSDSELLYCFQENHCCLATALTFAKQTASELRSSFSGHDLLTEKQAGVIEAMLAGTGVFEVARFRSLVAN
ncbi:hypothetical protein [Burkholderia ubonensis]|uniref:hypothetical protein n=1 Tax=Burkholderia ubonensis TaxID=101571 RepID=UPI000A50A8AA|nr:hypothetical protein [Burkholderia ubonensis]